MCANPTHFGVETSNLIKDLPPECHIAPHDVAHWSDLVRKPLVAAPNYPIELGRKPRWLQRNPIGGNPAANTHGLLVSERRQKMFDPIGLRTSVIIEKGDN
jgi:hypothetical protein